MERKATIRKDGRCRGLELKGFETIWQAKNRVQIPIFPPFIEEPRNSSSYGAFCLGFVMGIRPLEPALPADSVEYANPCHFLDFGHAA